jgi:ribosomal protein S18 acetylase RimI-like enzyme
MGIIFAPKWRILENIPGGGFYVQGIAIEPEYRGAGIGSLLMRDLEGCAKTNGSSRLSLDVSAKNSDAMRFYKRLGMVETSVWPNSRFFPKVFIRMSKNIISDGMLN